MSETKRQKWDESVVISKGKQSIALAETYQEDLSLRLPALKITEHKANVSIFELRLSGKGVKLSEQKSNTSVQDSVVNLLNGRVVSIRKIVRSTNASREKLIAFGIGKRISLTVLGVAAAADMVVSAYGLNKDWCNSIGIIEKDITELTTITKSLFTADDNQEQSIYARKASTMNINALQRAIEDEITRISALGYHEFELTNPAAAKLFADLIPSTAPEKKATTAGKATA